VSTTIVKPTADGTGTGSHFVNASSQTTNLYASLIDASDSTYVIPSLITSTDGSVAYFVLGTALPSDVGTVTGVSIALRLTQGSAKSGTIPDFATVRIYQNDQTTALTAAATITDTASVANYTFTPSVTGLTTKAAWTNSVLAIATNNSAGNGTGAPSVYEASVTITYTPSASTVVRPSIMNGGQLQASGIKTGSVL